MENVEQVTIKMEEMRKQLSRLEVIGAVYNSRGVRFLVWNWSRFRHYDG